jgi:hypothetical protein
MEGKTTLFVFQCHFYEVLNSTIRGTAFTGGKMRDENA